MRTATATVAPLPAMAAVDLPTTATPTEALLPSTEVTAKATATLALATPTVVLPPAIATDNFPS